MSCADTIALLELAPLAGVAGAEADDALDPREARALREHLETCDPCRAQAEACARAYRSWTAATEADMRPLSPDLRERVLAAHARPEAKPTPGPDPVDPAAVEAVRRKVGLSCSFCRDRLARPDVVYCAECLAPHHLECFRAHGRCCLPGCETTRFVRPQEAEDAAPRPRQRGLLVVGLGLCSAAALTAGAAQLYYSVIKLRYPRPVPLAEVLQPQAVPAQPRGTPSHDVVELAAVDEPLGDVLDRLAADAETTILIAPELRTQRITVSATGDWREVVRYVALQAGARVDELAGGVFRLWRPATVSLELGRVPLRRALAELGRLTGVAILVDPQVEGQVGATLRGRDVCAAVEALAQASGAHVTWVQDRAAVVTRTPLPLDVAANLTGVAPPGGKPVSLTCRDLPLDQLLAEVGRQVGRQLSSPRGEVPPRVTATLRGVPWRHALAALARHSGWVVEHGQEDLLGLRPPRPLPLRARDCPFDAWAALLARSAGRGLAMNPWPTRVDLPAGELEPEEALRMSAAAHGLTVALEGSPDRRTLVVAPIPGWGPPVATTNQSDGQVLQATAWNADRAARAAVIDGVVLAPGALSPSGLALEDVEAERVRVTWRGAARELTFDRPTGSSGSGD